MVRMIKLITLFFCLTIIPSIASQKLSEDNKVGVAMGGYDLVSYHQFEEPKKGQEEYTYIYENLKLKFISHENLDVFKADPNKYLPQYGGNCAYGIAGNGKHFWGNPKSYEIYDGKLYFFYKRFFLDYRKKWLKKGADSLRIKADENWKIQYEN